MIQPWHCRSCLLTPSRSCQTTKHRCLNSLQFATFSYTSSPPLCIFANNSPPYSLNPLEMSPCPKEMNTLQTIYDAFLRKADLFTIPSGTFFSPTLIYRDAKRTFWYAISGWGNGRQTNTCAQCTFVFLLLTYDWLQSCGKRARDGCLTTDGSPYGAEMKLFVLQVLFGLFLRLQSVQFPLLGFIPMCWSQISAVQRDARTYTHTWVSDEWFYLSSCFELLNKQSPSQG